MTVYVPDVVCPAAPTVKVAVTGVPYEAEEFCLIANVSPSTTVVVVDPVAVPFLTISKPVDPPVTDAGTDVLIPEIVCVLL